MQLVVLQIFFVVRFFSRLFFRFCRFSPALAVALLVFTKCSAFAEQSLLATDDSVIDMVIASIDGEPVTMTDLRHFVQSQGASLPAGAHADSPELKKALRDLVVQQLLTKAAHDANISVSDDDVNAYIAEVKKQNGLDEESFREQLRGRGLSYEDYVVQIRSDILRARVIGQKTRQKIQVLDEDIDKYLHEQPEVLPQEGTERLQVIVFSPAGQSDEEARALALRARGDVLAGKSMKEAGGASYQDLGYVKVEDLRKDLQEAVAKLESGKVSEVKQVDQGYAVFLVNGGDAGSDGKFREEIRSVLYQKKLKEAVDQYVNDELPKKYNVELKI